MTDLQMTGRQTWRAWWSILVQHDCNESPHEGDAKGKARQNEDKATGLAHGLAFYLWHRIRELGNQPLHPQASLRCCAAVGTHATGYARVL